MKTSVLVKTLIAAAFAAGPAARAADWWFTVYKGDKHVGYCHVVESTSNLGGAVVKRLTFVTEAEMDKAGRYTFKETADRYHDAAGDLVLYSTVTTYKEKVSKVVAAKTKEKKFKGFRFTLTENAGTEKENVKSFDVAEDLYDLLEVEEALAKVTAPGTRVEAQALNLDTGKVEKIKIEYVADQTLDVGGAGVAAKCLQAKGGLGGGQWWFDESGILVKYVGPSSLGKITTTRVADSAAAMP